MVREESEAGQALPWLSVLLRWPGCDVRVFKSSSTPSPLLCHPKSVFELKKLNNAEFSEFATHTTA